MTLLQYSLDPLNNNTLRDSIHDYAKPTVNNLTTPWSTEKHSM